MEEWEGAPVAEEALAAYEAEAAKAYTAAVKSKTPSVRLTQLGRFLKKWDSRAPTVTSALAEQDTLLEDIYNEIMAEKSPRSRNSKLKSFAKKYADIPWGKKAAEAVK